MATAKITTTAPHPRTWLETKNFFSGRTSHTICRCIDRARIKTVQALDLAIPGKPTQRNVLATNLPHMSAISPPVSRKEPDQAHVRLEYMSWGVIRSKHCSGFAARGTTNPSWGILAKSTCAKLEWKKMIYVRKRRCCRPANNYLSNVFWWPPRVELWKSEAGRYTDKAQQRWCTQQPDP